MNIKKLFILITIILTGLLIMTGCSNETNDNYTIIYTDSFGYTTTFEKKPVSIVSLSPNVTEIICALELEENLIGVTDFCDYPLSVKKIQSVGSVTEPNIELIMQLNPDIIITDGVQSEQIINKIRDLGLKVIITRANETFDGTFDIIEDIAKVTGKDEKANEIITEMKTELNIIFQKVEQIQDKKKVYYSISLSEAGLFTAGNNTYINELLNKAGLINIASDMEGWTYNIENLLINDPDYIICSNLNGEKNDILQYEPLKDLKAVKNQRIIEIDENLIARQSPRNIDGIKLLLKEIYNIEF